MVSANTIRTTVGICGNIISLVLFLSPLPTFHRIWKKGTVEQFSPVPYLATLLNCMLWVVYGLPLVHPRSTLVLTINGSGTVIELIYVVIFILYSSSKKRRLSVTCMLLGEVAFVLLVAVLVVLLVHSVDERSTVVGVLCVIFGTMMYAAPLSVMKTVIHSKSVEFMPLFLSVASFLNAACWTTYALIRFDLFVTIPNSLGVIFATAQLILHAMYHKSTKKQMDSGKGKEVTALCEVVVIGEAKKETSTAPQNGSRN